ncbi:MAG: hypothetical protein QM709_06955 [Spongiibacteraceae bacterium]
MKILRALIFPLASFVFSAVAHAAPVQYQLTATHTTEYVLAQGDTAFTPVSQDEYWLADGASITATFYYDSAVAPTSANVPVTLTGTSGTYTALRSIYLAFSNLNFEVANHSIYAPLATAVVFDANNTSSASRDSIQAVSSGNGFNQLIFGDYTGAFGIIIIGGNSDMLSNQALPNTLTEVNSLYTGITIRFSSANNTRTVEFSNGTISQVPLPTSALFFLSGLIGLGANAARKLKR